MQQNPQVEDEGAADSAPETPQRMDKAVRAALNRRPPEPRTFGNEDDMEGPKVAARHSR